MKYLFERSSGGTFLEPDKLYKGKIVEVKDVDNNFYNSEKDSDLHKRQFEFIIETDEGIVVTVNATKKYGDMCKLKHILDAVGCIIEDPKGVEFETGDVVGKKLQFTTTKGKEMTNQETGEGKGIFFARVDKFYLVDEDVELPRSVVKASDDFIGATSREDEVVPQWDV